MTTFFLEKRDQSYIFSLFYFFSQNTENTPYFSIGPTFQVEKVNQEQLFSLVT